jgi:hypothetical protein
MPKEYEPKDQIWEMQNTVIGPITQGQIDVFVRHLRKVCNSEGEEARVQFDRLKKVDPRIWGHVVKHPDFVDVLDALMVKAALGIISLSKEQREWFKMVQARAGITKDMSNGKGRPYSVVVNKGTINVQPGTNDWIEPKDGSLPEAMKARIESRPLEGTIVEDNSDPLETFDEP